MSEIFTINRYSIDTNEENPKFIKDENFKRLKKTLKKHGQIVNLIINKRTGKLVNGHQRLRALDEIHKDKDYDVMVVYVDLDHKDALKLAVELDAQDAQGEFDPIALKNIMVEYEINLQDILSETTHMILDLPSFEVNDIDKLVDDINQNVEFNDISDDTYGQQQEPAQDIGQSMSQQKQQYKQELKDERESYGESINPVNQNYFLSLVWQDNGEKADFMTKIGLGAEVRSMSAIEFLECYEEYLRSNNKEQ